MYNHLGAAKRYLSYFGIRSVFQFNRYTTECVTQWVIIDYISKAVPSQTIQYNLQDGIGQTTQHVGSLKPYRWGGIYSSL